MFYRGRHDSPDTYCRGWRCPCPALCPAQDPPPAATARILSPLLLPLFRIVNLVSHSLPSVVPRTRVPRLVKVDSICYASPRIIFNVTDKCPTLVSPHRSFVISIWSRFIITPEGLPRLLYSNICAISCHVIYSGFDVTTLCFYLGSSQYLVQDYA